jgi:hypothetical protein
LADREAKRRLNTVAARRSCLFMFQERWRPSQVVN